MIVVAKVAKTFEDVDSPKVLATFATRNLEPMEIQSTSQPIGPRPNEPDDSQLREKFTQFVGQTLFGSMLASMRKSVGKPAYMHGGRTEEVFQQQLDNQIVDELTKASADTIADPMYELFHAQRGLPVPGPVPEKPADLTANPSNELYHLQRRP